MTTANEAWIQNSLERLEALEQERAQLAEGGAGEERLAELDEEIRTLYEALESAAAAEDDDDDAATAAYPSVPVTPKPEVASPFAQPVVAAPPQPEPAMMSPMSDMDFDDEPKSSRAPLFVGLIVVLGLVGGGGWYFTQMKQPEAPPAEPSAPKVITASEVPDDTQDPNVARGADAERTQGTRFKEGASQPNQRRPSSSSPGSSRPRQSSSDKSKSADKIELAGSRDPLAGVK